MGLLGVPFCDNVPQDYRCLCEAPSHRDLGCKPSSTDACGRATAVNEVQRLVDALVPVTPATARRMAAPSGNIWQPVNANRTRHGKAPALGVDLLPLPEPGEVENFVTPVANREPVTFRLSHGRRTCASARKMVTSWLL